jgi:methylated-DNA-[protein]-cysteine S-methyltransferase
MKTPGYWSTVDTKAGPFTTIVDTEGVVLSSGWTADINNLTPQIASRLKPTQLSEKPDLGKVTRAILDYHEGDLSVIDGIEVQQISGEFLQHAWDVLRTVPAGNPISYAEFATLSGRPAAVRAAATACARNAAALFVPCHRVIRTGGDLGGFRWGLDVKRWLLAHETK